MKERGRTAGRLGSLPKNKRETISLPFRLGGFANPPKQLWGSGLQIRLNEKRVPISNPPKRRPLPTRRSVRGGSSPFT